VPLKEEVLGEFLGDESFPIEWASETEKLLFWVYDDLHNPKPLSPMFEDIGGWSLRDPVRDGLDLQEHQRLLLHDGDPGRGRPRRRDAGVQLPDQPDRPRGLGVREADRRVPRCGPAGLRQQLHLLVADPVRPGDGEELRVHRGHARQARRAEPRRLRRPPRGRDRHARPPLEDPLDAELRAAQRDAQPPGGHGEDPRQGRRGAAGPAPELLRRPELGQDPRALGDEGGGQGRRRAAPGVLARDRCRDHPGPRGDGARPAVHRRTRRSSAGTPCGATSSSSRTSSRT
jgi:hypothetical protein